MPKIKEEMSVNKSQRPSGGCPTFFNPINPFDFRAYMNCLDSENPDDFTAGSNRETSLKGSRQ